MSNQRRALTSRRFDGGPGRGKRPRRSAQGCPLGKQTKLRVDLGTLHRPQAAELPSNGFICFPVDEPTILGFVEAGTAITGVEWESRDRFLSLRRAPWHHELRPQPAHAPARVQTGERHRVRGL